MVAGSLYKFAHSEKLGFGGAGLYGFFFLRGQVRGTVQDKGRIEGLTVAVAGLGETLFDLEV